jgi:hypothetical protein
LLNSKILELCFSFCRYVDDQHYYYFKNNYNGTVGIDINNLDKIDPSSRSSILKLSENRISFVKNSHMMFQNHLSLLISLLINLEEKLSSDNLNEANESEGEMPEEYDDLVNQRFLINTVLSSSFDSDSNSYAFLQDEDLKLKLIGSAELKGLIQELKSLK